MSTGKLVFVEDDAGREVFFQIVNANLHREQSIDANSRAFIRVEAEQLGVWIQNETRFATFDWVPSPNSLAYLADTIDVGAENLSAASKVIGKIPQSNYPAILNIDDLVLYHSAILGVTGSGKSFLAYEVIEACAGNNIKCVCVDPSGDYKRFLPNAVCVRTPSDIRRFLESDYMISVIEPSDDARATDSTMRIAEQCLSWCKEHRANEEIGLPRPKVLLVLEEAHMLVPEWTFTPDQASKNNVNSTSQIALQARKYGLGFLVVTQRTANVTKSILNQCNTIISFQAFDETSFDFLRNYMGSHHVSALPNLRQRSGIVVGKASLSDRPIIVDMTQQTRDPKTEDFLELPAPENDDSLAGPHVLTAE